MAAVVMDLRNQQSGWAQVYPHNPLLWKYYFKATFPNGVEYLVEVLYDEDTLGPPARVPEWMKVKIQALMERGYVSSMGHDSDTP